MSAVISALTSGLTTAVFFSTLADVMPFVILVVPFALGLFFLRRLIQGAGRGRAKI